MKRIDHAVSMFAVLRAHVRGAARCAVSIVRGPLPNPPDSMVLGIHPGDPDYHANQGHPSQLCRCTQEEAGEGHRADCRWRLAWCRLCTGNGWCQRCAGDGVDPAVDLATPAEIVREVRGCQSHSDGDCFWSECPQNDPATRQDHCPLDICTCEENDGYDHDCPLHGGRR